ncbi:ADP-ribosylhydrolase ARH3-like [Lutzomyia longipalpis]|uniref:ADP-ribosylhydrolase ARH3 n=2 Tax=Lutzomyia longipalpis TaxID=7200 RepID=A0A1B0CIZ9_LUTLO|nr:ADP-ribosylhydrolase ARH3-like [Lutzomyia longipalpis]
MKLSAKIMEQGLLTSKFRGTLQGALIGDCCGSPYEGEPMEDGTKIVLRKFLQKLSGPYFTAPYKPYTDDTAMTISVAEELIENKGVDQTRLARRFVQRYFAAPNRGYGGGAMELFAKLRSSRFENITQLARNQFGGRGSFGNGAAMRVSPVPLFCVGNESEMVELVKKQAEITHSHKLGINGAILQALAIHQSLNLNPMKPIDTQQFVEDLIRKMKSVEKDEDDIETRNPEPYHDQLKEITSLLGKTEPSDEAVLNGLGHSVAALYSVPTAIYCFLRSLSEIESIPAENPFMRCLEYSISLGGDTDTIASMACAISGAFYGESIIPASLLKHCEASEEITGLADALNKAIRE